MTAYAGIDLGATNIRVVVGDETGEVLGRDKRKTPPGPTGIDITELVLDAIREASGRADIEPGALEGVGIGSIGPLNQADGMVENPANLPDTIDTIPLTGPISNLTKTDDIFLHNDGTAGVIGERFYSDRNPDDMAYVSISSGIGAGVAVDGNVISGWDGNAGEVGHMMVDPDKQMMCGCGNPGHWEAYASGENIPKYAREVYNSENWETNMNVMDAGFTAGDLFAQAGGDKFAAELIDRIATFNTMGVANIVQAYAPLIIYVGGAVAQNNPGRVVGKIRDRLPEMVFGNIPEIELTTLGDDVVVKGALASAVTGGPGEA